MKCFHGFVICCLRRVIWESYINYSKTLIFHGQFFQSICESIIMLIIYKSFWIQIIGFYRNNQYKKRVIKSIKKSWWSLYPSLLRKRWLPKKMWSTLLIECDKNSGLLRSLMLAGFAEWSLVLLLFLLKSKQLVNFAIARRDIWLRCIHDFSKSKKYSFPLII